VSIPFFEVFSTALAAIYSVVGNFGLSIILLTIAVRVVLLPLTIKQTKSMREMQRIQPQVKRLQQKYKGDRQKLNAETMALYKEHGVNPFGGCAPLLLQFPVLIALYWVIRQPLEYMQHIADWVLPRALERNPLDVNRFLGLRLDCSAATARVGEGSEFVPVACGDGIVDMLPYLVLIAAMGFTTYYQQRQMQAAQGPSSPQAQQMQMFTRIMPIFLMVIGYTFPAALVLYWTITNVWTIGQQRLMLKGFPPILHHEEPEIRAETGSKGAVKAGGTKPTGGKPASKGRSPATGRKAPAASSPSARRKRKR
jgi:YidC/Oxa1 family membrane protein insertase